MKQPVCIPPSLHLIRTLGHIESNRIWMFFMAYFFAKSKCLFWYSPSSHNHVGLWMGLSSRGANMMSSHNLVQKANNWLHLVSQQHQYTICAQYQIINTIICFSWPEIVHFVTCYLITNSIHFVTCCLITNSISVVLVYLLPINKSQQKHTHTNTHTHTLTQTHTHPNTLTQTHTP